jgi:hypothetical protein
MDYSTVTWALLKDGELLHHGAYGLLCAWGKQNLPDFPAEPPEGTWFTGSEFDVLCEEKREKEEGPPALKTAGVFYEVVPDAPLENIQKQAVRIAKESKQPANFMINGTLHTVYPNGQIVHTRPKRKRKCNA